jgi:hypothetical protein
MIAPKLLIHPLIVRMMLSVLSIMPEQRNDILHGQLANRLAALDRGLG